MNIILFTKRDKPAVEKVIKCLKGNFKNVRIYKGERQEPFPQIESTEPADILISYLSPWVIPKKILDRTRLWNINFHPGPPEYPGIGCFNFAIYNGEKEYGVTAHIMEERVDSGKIIAVRRFPLYKSDSVLTLSLKSYEHMFDLFLVVIDLILRKKTLPDSSEAWQRKPYTRKELNDLCVLENGMEEEEIERRVKATAYPGMPGAHRPGEHVKK